MLIQCMWISVVILVEKFVNNRCEKCEEDNYDEKRPERVPFEAIAKLLDVCYNSNMKYQ